MTGRSGTTMAWQSAGLATPVGPVTVAAGPRGVRRVLLAVDPDAALAVLSRELGNGRVGGRTDWVDDVRRELEGYFAGSRGGFRAPLDLSGTRFQMKVWRAICRIPYAMTRTYGEVARAMGQTGGARAVGQAAGANPVPLIIPCHRVVGSSGGLGGFGSGLAMKRWLLEFESKNR